MNKTIIYLLASLIYIIAYVYSIHFAPILAGAESGWRRDLNDVHESCLVGCRGGICKLSVRGDNYYINSTDSAKRRRLSNCMVTFWGFSHFLLYSILGFLFPGIFWETFFVGVAFEMYEAAEFDCHDTFDIILNSAGFLAGKYLRRLLF